LYGIYNSISLKEVKLRDLRQTTKAKTKISEMIELSVLMKTHYATSFQNFEIVPQRGVHIKAEKF
jgi:hypothetical protein